MPTNKGSNLKWRPSTAKHFKFTRGYRGSAWNWDLFHLLIAIKRLKTRTSKRSTLVGLPNLWNRKLKRRFLIISVFYSMDEVIIQLTLSELSLAFQETRKTVFQHFRFRLRLCWTKLKLGSSQHWDLIEFVMSIYSKNFFTIGFVGGNCETNKNT